MEYTYKYGKSDKRSKRLTLLWFILVVVILVGVWYVWGAGGYVVVSTAVILLSFMLLCLISIPQKVVIDESGIQIRCVLDITYIPVSEILSVKRIDRREMRAKMPICAGYGFFGYYGYWLNFRNWKLIRLYCKEWNNFVEIVDANKKTYYISCSDRVDFMPAVNKMFSLNSEIQTCFAKDAIFVKRDI